MRKASVRGIETRRGTPARRPTPAVPVKPLLFGVILLAVGLTAWLMLFQPSAPRPITTTAATDAHSGSILIPFAGHTACRHLTFDNVSGSIKDDGIGQCGDSSPGAAERLNQVSQSFQRR